MKTAKVRRGVLLVNLGTPDAPTSSAVRRYLKEFLSDPRVLDIHPLGRWLLLNAVILPFRSSKSAEAYRKVWTEEGSPLGVFTGRLSERVAQLLQGQCVVEWAMRYGNPSLSSALERLRSQGVESLTVVALYPQYASSSTGSSLERVYQLVGQQWNVMPIEVVTPFYDQPEFLNSWTEVARPALEKAQPDHLLFSFHGLPERQIRKSDDTGRHCFASAGCCDQISTSNTHCYRAQCYATARALAEQLGWAPARYSVAFQSRLGRTPWIKPYTDLLLPELARKGVKKIAVICPSFVSDCLETLEEIGIRARADFKAAGGEELFLVPSLNDHPVWAEAVVKLAGF